jgi:hypothetical protein
VTFAQNGWLANVASRQNTMDAFLQYCVLPRCFASNIDAVYCGALSAAQMRFAARLIHACGCAAKFAEVVHSLGTPHFNVPDLIDRVRLRACRRRHRHLRALGAVQIIRSVPSIINSCTAHESQRFGRFLASVLQRLHAWKADEVRWPRSGPSGRVADGRAHGPGRVRRRPT